MLQARTTPLISHIRKFSVLIKLRLEMRQWASGDRIDANPIWLPITVMNVVCNGNTMC